MRLRLAELGIALLLAWGFASVGEWLRGAPARTVRDWNESFLSGFGLAAALLVPLSMALPGRALTVLAVLVGLAAAGSLLRRAVLRRTGAHPPDSGARGETGGAEGSIRHDPVALAAAAAIGAAILAFAVLNARFTFGWDGFQIWVTKARVLFHEGSLTPLLFSEADYEGRIVGYPDAIPFFEAMLCRVRGGFDFGAVKPVFLVFYVSLAAGAYSLARAFLSRRVSLVAVAMLLWLPGMSLGLNLGGYVDMPLGAAVATAAGAALRFREDPRSARAAPWLIGSLAFYKNEGMLLAAGFCGLMLLAAVADTSVEGRAFLRAAWRRIAVSGLVVAALLATAKLYVRWTKNPDDTYDRVDWAHIARAPKLLPVIVRGVAAQLGDPGRWWILWPAFAVAAVVVAFRGSRSERLVALGAFLALSVYALIFLFTRWDVALHIASAYDRLPEHVAALAVVTIAVAWERWKTAGRGSESGAAADE